MSHRNDVGHVQVDDALDVRPVGVDGGVQDEAGDVDAEVGGARLHDGALHVDLDQAGGRDLVVEHAEGVDEEMLRVLADAEGDVVVHVLRPAVHVHQAVGGRQLAPQLLLGLGVAHALQAADVVDGDHAHAAWEGYSNQYFTP